MRQLRKTHLCQWRYETGRRAEESFGLGSLGQERRRYWLSHVVESQPAPWRLVWLGDSPAGIERQDDAWREVEWSQSPNCCQQRKCRRLPLPLLPAWRPPDSLGGSLKPWGGPWRGWFPL